MELIHNNKHYYAILKSLFIASLLHNTSSAVTQENTTTCVTSDRDSCDVILESSYVPSSCKVEHNISTGVTFNLTVILPREYSIYALQVVQCSNDENIKTINMHFDDGEIHEFELLQSSGSAHPMAISNIFYFYPSFTKSVTIEATEMYGGSSLAALNYVALYDTSTKFNVAQLGYGSSCSGSVPGCEGALDSIIAGVYRGITIEDSNRWIISPNMAVNVTLNITFVKPFFINEGIFYQLYEEDHGSFCNIEHMLLEFSDKSTKQVTLREDCSLYGETRYFDTIETQYVYITILSTYTDDSNMTGFEEIQFFSEGPYRYVTPTRSTQPTSAAVTNLFGKAVLLVLTTVIFVLHT